MWWRSFRAERSDMVFPDKLFTRMGVRLLFSIKGSCMFFPWAWPPLGRSLALRLKIVVLVGFWGGLPSSNGRF